ncbi:conserved hypothetical protein [Candidatus Sulfopaludibacter sp. SbA4]|nr:conserved hypothetical protein [Candidatus Sulfopaludibacter sp. SbA4]
MRNVTAALAEGPDFFDRIKEMNNFWRDLETDNLLLLAPRRVGKTALMHKMAANAGAYGFNIIFVDVSDCSSEMHFMQRLYEAICDADVDDNLWNDLKDSWLGKTVKRVRKIGGAGFSLEFDADGAARTRLSEELADTLSRLEGAWLIQVDELPVFVLKLLNQDASAGRARVREFLYWMRRLRLQYTGVRWMLAGSIGLDTVAARLNIADAINDLHIVTLGAFDEPTTDALLQALATEHRVDLKGIVRRHIVSRIGWTAPYYVQLVFHELRSIEGAVTEADVDRAIEDLLSPYHRNAFDYWRQRLPDELGQTHADNAVILLDQCCRAPEGAMRFTLNLALARTIGDARIRAEETRYLLAVLQNDGYIVHEGDRLLFRSPLLREYWLRTVAPQE